MQKILFIDRDGTIIKEPADEQIDSFEKLVFLPDAISVLRKIAEELDFMLVMVSNQDGLGSENFPESNFLAPHNLMMQTLAGESIHFQAVHIDKSYASDNLPTRKPGTAMLTEYLSGDYDLANSYVIGDRLTDVQLAKNLGTKAILINAFEDSEIVTDATLQLICAGWQEIYHFLKLPPRIAEIQRNTQETKIYVSLNLDGNGKTAMQTGIGFFDHMLDQLAKHSGCDIKISVVGDLHIDEHHTIEDTALALGEAFLKALGDKKGISRYGFLLPMDEALAQVALDFSGRPWLVWEAEFKREKIGEMPTEMFFHFFKSFSDTAKCNLNIKVSGDNEHHKIESIFKAFAKAIKMAVTRDIKNLQVLPSTKGVL
ncbi:MAG: bifunctional histidinol-phosphatase/imidazoleglycerol-phosphate dehydratase HisB [Verrucomicrobia bacterium]|nr:bifunctional histidinol-phosphatase/imidazoleglycerol-phosphate dehydratase HisB [Cytophagales bacterium]